MMNLILGCMQARSTPERGLRFLVYDPAIEGLQTILQSAAQVPDHVMQTRQDDNAGEQDEPAPAQPFVE